MDYSIIIPIYNEVDTIPELWLRLHQVLSTLNAEWEVIFVDDGSEDGSLDLLLHLNEEFKTAKVISLSRNFGHQPALTAGLDHTEARAAILMDGDLQDLPEAIPSFIDKWKEGFEVVFAIREKRKESPLKQAAFKLFYQVQTKLANTSTPPDAGIFSLLDRKVVQTLKRMPERNKYLSGLRAYAGFRQTGILVERGARFSGEPKVSLWKLLKLALDGIFSFSTVPLRLISIMGIAVSALSFLVGTGALVLKYLFGHQFFSWQFGLTTVSFIAGIQLLSIGILGEYLGRIYDEVKQRPYYVIGRTFGFSPHS